MGIVHRVPTLVLFDLQMIVPANKLQSAASLICSNHPYAPLGPMDLHEIDHWRDYKLLGESGPFVFDNTGTSTILLHHTVPSRIRESSYEPNLVLLHVPSVYHIDLHDPTRTIFNPNPPDWASEDVRFPSLPAFIDSIIDMNPRQNCTVSSLLHGLKSCLTISICTPSGQASRTAITSFSQCVTIS